jgi:hypothetical protein
MPGAFDPDELFPGHPQQQQMQMPTFPLPAGEFDPREWIKQHPDDPDITGWAHDDTVKPGQVYRYRVVYKIKNPVFGAPNLVENPKDAEQFALSSKETAWTDAVDVPSMIRFWLASARSAAGSARFQVFRWHDGEHKSKTYDVSAGDAIGKKEDAADFATGWTLVDVLEDPRTKDVYVLLLGADGRVHRRDASTDATDPKFKEMREQVATAAASAGP